MTFTCVAPGGTVNADRAVAKVLDYEIAPNHRLHHRRWGLWSCWHSRFGRGLQLRFGLFHKPLVSRLKDRVLGADFVSVAIFLQSFSQAARLLQRPAKIVMRIRILRVNAQCLAVFCDRSFPVTLAR